MKRLALSLALAFTLPACQSGVDPRLIAALDTGLNIAAARGKISPQDAADARALINALPVKAPEPAAEPPLPTVLVTSPAK